MKIPFMRPDIGSEEINAVTKVMESGWLTTGPVTREFEQAFAAHVGAKHALAVNSATAGLHLALEALGVGPGDKVVTTVMTFTATAEVIRYLGADPVFVDIDEDTLNISVEGLRQAFETYPDIKVIVPVHFAGHCCEMDEIAAIAAEFGARVMEDAAHSLPSAYKGKEIGSLSAATVFSFYVTKTMTTGEGGMVTTDDDALAERVRVMRLHGISKDIFNRYTSDKPNWYYEVIAPGYKYNLTDIASAIGIEQLKKAEHFREQREAICEHYEREFASLPATLPVSHDYVTKHSWHLFILKLSPEDGAVSRDVFIERLSEKGVGTSVHFIPLHLHPYWRDTYALSAGQFPVADKVFQQIVSLPLFPGMDQAQIDYVCETVKSCLPA